MESFEKPINVKDAISIQVLQGFERKTLAYNSDTTMTFFTVKKGKKHPIHDHENAQIGYIIKGKVKFRTDRGEFVVVEGDSYVFNRFEKHGAEFLEDTEMIAVFSPARDEYTTPDKALPTRKGLLT